MTQLTIFVGDELFAFNNFADWVRNAKELFANNRPASANAICLDTKGRVCTFGEDFAIARDDDSFPIRVFARRDDL